MARRRFPRHRHRESFCYSSSITLRVMQSLRRPFPRLALRLDSDEKFDVFFIRQGSCWSIVCPDDAYKFADRQSRRNRHPRSCAPPPNWASRTVAIFSEDDAPSLHTRKADERRRAAAARAPAAYLDVAQIVAVAQGAGCDAIHPGYGFLSENAAFARRCAEDGIDLRRPAARNARAVRRQGRRRARWPTRCGVAGAARNRGPDQPEEAKAFSRRLGRRRRDDDQGGRRRRRPRHARRAPARRTRRGLRALRSPKPAAASATATSMSSN